MKNFNELIKIIKKLRNPISGCPWDKKQTPDTIKEYIIEEAYELKAAIDQKSIIAQKEEAGDLLLQIILLARMHQEENNFTIEKIIEQLINKLIKRHPHVFGDKNCSDEFQVQALWEKIKKTEKNKDSIISNYPHDMPALMVAKRIGEQASSIGFDWKKADKALLKVEEEIEELKKTIKTASIQKQQEEIGDLLFAVVNVARLLKINPEDALKSANEKFKRRFKHIEDTLVKNQDKKYTLDQLEALWTEAKKANIN